MIPKKIWANSGDSHFMEPPDLFTNGLPKALADRMPKSRKFDVDRERLIFHGAAPAGSDQDGGPPGLTPGLLSGTGRGDSS